MTLTRRGRRLFKGGEDDEDTPSSLPSSSIDDVATQDKSNEVRIGTMTRARAKLLEQQVNSLLIDYDVCDSEHFILPKSLHLCMIKVINNASIGGEDEEQQGLDDKNHKCVREASAQGEKEAKEAHGGSTGPGR